MLNLTDPQLAPLVARYRARVEEQNVKDKYRFEHDVRSNPDEEFRPNVRHCQGFLDWAIREGIKVPKGGV